MGKTVAKMRRHRMWMVQTADQYLCIHRAIHEIFKQRNRVLEKKESVVSSSYDYI